MLSVNLSMKTLLSTLGLLSALAGTASAAPYVLPSDQTGNLNSFDWQPVYSIEAVAAIADEDGTPDMWGPRFSMGLYSANEGDFIHEFNVSLAALFGNTTVTDIEYGSADQDATMVPFTIGYDLYVNIIGDLYLDLGANVGYSFGSYTIDKWNVDETDSGATFSVGAGLLYKPSEDIYVKLGYEYGRTYYDRQKAGIVDQHMITLGVGCQF